MFFHYLSGEDIKYYLEEVSKFSGYDDLIDIRVNEDTPYNSMLPSKFTPAPRIRSIFPETWIFNQIIETEYD